MGVPKNKNKNKDDVSCDGRRHPHLSLKGCVSERWVVPSWELATVNIIFPSVGIGVYRLHE